MTNHSKDLDKSNTYRYAPSVMSKLSFLPQSKPDSPSVRKTNGNSSITVSASNGEWAYGAAPRMFLIYIRSLIKNGSDRVNEEHHIVYLDDTYNSFCNSVGIKYSGSNKDNVMKMVENLATTSIVLKNWSTDGFIAHSFFVANTVALNYGTDENKKSFIEFSPEMWALLTENCVPLNPSIVRQLRNDALALDVYQWLAFRAHAMRHETRVTWEALLMQFKYDGYPMREFRRKFKRALEKIQLAWPELKVEVTETGVIVRSSLPSIQSANDDADTDAGVADDEEPMNPFVS
ncbi:replication protein RepA [Bifidobacterium adolescentis]|uniref:Replication protein RepA n=1 Tax=Bifidobacterium adolescentis TaxID=1680 RepID=A0AAW5JV50_BIFAD|nr:replication protein RepA [Bifidobacterium adolescentis]MCQ4793643.1 replication protein RepA [Bifidobacterium adolescentis]